MIEKLWRDHLVARLGDGVDLLYIDRYLIGSAVPGGSGTPARTVAAEQGVALPGAAIVGGDRRTAILGAFGCLATDVDAAGADQVRATRCLTASPPPTIRISVDGILKPQVAAADLALAAMAEVGVGGCAGHAVEFAGRAVRNLTQEGRMTVCGIAIEAGARFALVAPDERTFRYLRGRSAAPVAAAWTSMVAYGHGLASDAGAAFTRELALSAEEIGPMVTWGPHPAMAAPITARVPDPARQRDPERRAAMRRTLADMGLMPGTPLGEVTIAHVLIGGCAEAGLEDLRAAAAVAKGREVADGVTATIRPGSPEVRAQAEREGLDRVLAEAGFDWCGAGGASDGVGGRWAATSLGGGDGAPGGGGRVHLMSSAMAAAAAVTGRLIDMRTLVLRPARRQVPSPGAGTH